MPDEAQDPVEPTEEVVGVNIATIVLSPKFQAFAGPLSNGLILFGVAGTYIAMWLGIPRAVLIAAFGLGTGVAVASVAVTLGIILLVAKQTPNPRAALLSVALGIVSFVGAGPVFLLIWATNS